MIERKPRTVLVIEGENTVGQPLIKAARPMALPCRIVDTDCDKLPVEKSEAQVIQMHGRRSSGAVQTLRTSNAAEWNDVLPKMRQHDFHHLPQYHRVAEQHGEGIARLFAYSANGYTIALPLLLRLADTNEPEGWTDATLVYGYAGPVASHEWLPESFLQTFQGTLRDELSRARVVSVFSRLPPLIPQQEMLAGLGECVGRNRINRLARSEVNCELDVEQCHLSEFVALYHETMSRVQAKRSYYFNATYFANLAKNFGPVLKLFVVRMPDGEVISGGLFTLCDGIVQYHLGATRSTALKLSATVLIFEIVRHWAHENGAHIFHLGGGVGGKTDSLFHFKAHFSRRRHEFVTWRWIVAPETYRELSRQKQLLDSERGLRAISPSFFPAYRCRSEPDTVPAGLRAPAPAMAAPDEIQIAQNG
jgi:Acetyltransferase (GNAT) domain